MPEKTPDAANRHIPDWALLVTVFITGACVLIIELIGTRLLAPWFGSGIYTWSALIAVTLAALALGYAFGGRLADRLPRPDLLFNLCLAAGLWTLSTPMLAGLLLPFMIQTADIRIGVLLSSLFLYFPSLFLLGAIGPFVIRLMTRERNTVGSTSGRVFAVSTIGSLLGALGTGFILIPNVGVTAIFAFCGGLLLALAIIGNFRPRFIGYALILASIIVSLMFITGRKPAAESAIELLDQTPSYYGTVQVIRKHDQKSLLVDGIGQNYVSDRDSYTTGYVNFIATLPEIRDTPGSNRDALVIGLGAGQLPMQFQRLGYYVDTVEIDPKVGTMAARHFGFSLPAGQIHYTDGRVFLLRTDRSYEYIVIDAFSAEQIASHLVTLEAFEDARARLSDTGVLVINVTSTATGDDIAAMRNTMTAVFPHVRAFSMEGDTGLTSIVLLASRIPIRLDINKVPVTAPQFEDARLFVAGELLNFDSGILLTDDFNPVSFQRRRIQLLWRELMIDYLGEDNVAWLSL